MIGEIILLLFGLIFLVLGANLLLEGAIKLSKKFGWSKLFIGITIVTLGTTAPELTVSILSAFMGTQNLGLGNVMGSNLFNILVILGFTAIFFEIKNNKEITKESLFALASILLVWFFSIISLHGETNTISSIEGLLMLFLLGLFTYFAAKNLTPKNISIKHVFEDKIAEKILLGALLLFVGGNFAVTNVTLIARHLNVSEFIIGATIISFGTTLPELTTFIIAALKKQQEISVGNILGSTIYNTLGVLGISAIISPINTLGYHKFFAFNAFAIILLISLLYTGKKGTLNRPEGILMLLSYIIIFVVLILNI